MLKRRAHQLIKQHVPVCGHFLAPLNSRATKRHQEVHAASLSPQKRGLWCLLALPLALAVSTCLPGSIAQAATAVDPKAVDLATLKAAAAVTSNAASNSAHDQSSAAASSSAAATSTAVSPSTAATAATTDASSPASALNSTELLQGYLANIHTYSAKFNQELTDRMGQVLSSGAGHIYLQRPDRFMMHTTEPDEIALYTNGSDIYYYDEAVNQLTISSLSNLGSNNPLLLLTNSEDVSWSDYYITHDELRFTLVPTNQSEFNSITISFKQANDSESLLIESLSIRMEDGNTNFYLFTDAKEQVSEKSFNYQLPEDVEIDDQR